MAFPTPDTHGRPNMVPTHPEKMYSRVLPVRLGSSMLALDVGRTCLASISLIKAGMFGRFAGDVG